MQQCLHMRVWTAAMCGYVGTEVYGPVLTVTVSACV